MKMKLLVGAMIVAMATTVGACQRKESSVKADKQVTVVEKKMEKLSLDSLDKRVTKLENRLDAAKAARARTKAVVQ